MPDEQAQEAAIQQPVNPQTRKCSETDLVLSSQHAKLWHDAGRERDEIKVHRPIIWQFPGASPNWERMFI
jgi:hypothetical protein